MSVARISGPQLLDTALWTASGEEKAELHAWEKENLDRSDHPDVGTADWPGWRKYTGPPPRRRKD